MKRTLLKKVLKWTALTVGCIIGLILLVCTAVVWILNPAQLTPLVEREASKLIDGELHASRIELTFWHTFPHMTLDVDSLVVISHSLRNLPDSIQVPEGADTLLTVESLHGGINLLPLTVGHIALHDVLIHKPQANLVEVTPGKANYMIFSTDDSEENDSVSSLPMIPVVSLHRFAITDAEPLRYRSLPDSLDIALKLSNISLDAKESPRYSLSISGSARTPLLRDFDFKELTFGADGTLKWDSGSPLEITAENFTLGADAYSVKLTTDISLADPLTVRSLTAEIPDFPVDSLLRHLPEPARSLAAPLHTDMKPRAEMRLLSAWSVTDTVLPSIEASLTVPSCHMNYENLKVKEFALEATARFCGADSASNTVTIKHLKLKGHGVDISTSFTATDIPASPAVEGHIEGSLNLAAIPPRLRRALHGTLSGTLTADADVRCSLSDLTPKRFHRIYATGRLKARNFHALLNDMGEAYMHDGTVEFGSNKSFINNGHKIDSLLTLSVKADTLAVLMPSMSLRMRDLRLGGGTMNRASSADTTEINPLGVSLSFARMALDSPADSLRLRMADASVSGTLRRYEGNGRIPRVDLRFSSGGLAFGQHLTKMALREADVELTVHMRPRRSKLPASLAAERRKHLADSLAALPKVENMDFHLDSTDRNLLRRWNFAGHVHARSGRLVTPAFPLRNRLEQLDLHFNPDTVTLASLDLKAGQSDFSLKGTIYNLRRALTSRRGNNLGVELQVASDTINVNEIVQALYAGSTLTTQTDSATVWADDADETALDLAPDSTANAPAGPVLLPHNIDARFSMRARNIIYSDLTLHRMRGDILLYDAALTLNRLSASTDIGSIDLDGLYSAAAPDSLQFGLGMRVKNFRLSGLTSLVPAIDSIMPAMRSFGGTVNAEMAVTTDLTPDMDVDIPSLRAAISIEGDSLVLLDPDTFKSLSKWLMFKDKKRNYIDHLAVEAIIENSAIELYPFMFDIDRYRLGVMGHNDLAMNLNYHVSVLKSPLPFKFGINIKGTPEKMKIRVGKAKFKEGMVVERTAIATDTRINISTKLRDALQRGLQRARLAPLDMPQSDISRPAEAATEGTQTSVSRDKRKGRKSRNSAPRHLGPAVKRTAGTRTSESPEAFTVTDSLRMIRQGLIPNPDPARFPVKPLQEDTITNSDSEE